MREGVLPIRYLGVPSVSTKLSAVDYELLQKILGRVDSWFSKHISFVGRLQLVSSVLYSIQIYCSTIFYLT